MRTVESLECVIVAITILVLFIYAYRAITILFSYGNLAIHKVVQLRTSLPIES